CARGPTVPFAYW
nr:immunoglobulin heavy chain junction region [Mus musculus]